ncbi:MAG: type II toxin-antitoxin system death-on-curing family toxin [Acidobacteria bacterium]|nr:type II toxin-antitoxin system death-on-curing family toxin [Acidobacteriota bacterium]
MTRPTVYISVEEAIALHIHLMREWREIRFGVDRRDLLESALNRPKHAAALEGADIARQSATLCYGLIKNHPWLGGNKRTATYITEVFLEINGITLDLTDSEIVKLALDIEADRYNVDDIEHWLSKRIN